MRDHSTQLTSAAAKTMQKSVAARMWRVCCVADLGRASPARALRWGLHSRCVDRLDQKPRTPLDSNAMMLLNELCTGTILLDGDCTAAATTY